MTAPHILDDLAWRGLVAQSTDLDALRRDLDAGPVTLYSGIDPTAPSAHIGHLLQWLTLARFQQAGHRPIALVGGATGLIGDPKPTSERTLNDREVVADWVDKIGAQLRPFLDFTGEHAALLVNNLDWTEGISALDFLREYGKHFRVGRMLAKEAVSRRMESDEGISYAEFSYQILQSLDFLELFRRYGCTLQTGGSDQWGNLTAGIDLIHRVEGRSIHALGTPLITKADGSKFGKTEGGTVWLDASLTSPYAFYQFWINAEDAKVGDTSGRSPGCPARRSRRWRRRPSSGRRPARPSGARRSRYRPRPRRRETRAGGGRLPGALRPRRPPRTRRGLPHRGARRGALGLCWPAPTTPRSSTCSSAPAWPPAAAPPAARSPRAAPT